MKWTYWVLLAGLASLGPLQGCSVSGPRASPLPKSGPKMIDIYQRHVEENSAQAASAQASQLHRRDEDTPRAADAGSAASGMSATSAGRFVRLPNPDLEMYVYPHLAKGKYPIPGYTTVFPLFESVQYALPGEVPPPLPRQHLPLAR